MERTPEMCPQQKDVCAKEYLPKRHNAAMLFLLRLNLFRAAPKEDPAAGPPGPDRKNRKTGPAPSRRGQPKA